MKNWWRHHIIKSERVAGYAVVSILALHSYILMTGAYVFAKHNVEAQVEVQYHVSIVYDIYGTATVYGCSCTRSSVNEERGKMSEFP
jgi:hypothetical protein